MATPHRKTCRRHNIPNQAHFLTFSCFHRQPFLTRDRARTWLIDALRKAAVKHDFHLWAWVIMPEHVHLVLWPQRHDYSIAKILASIKKPVTNAALRYVYAHAPAFLDKMRDSPPRGKVVHRFWQRGGGYDRDLWSAQEVWEKIHYVHHNPVLRGLVARPEEWEWSSMRDYLGLRTPPLLPLDRTGLPVR